MGESRALGGFLASRSEVSFILKMAKLAEAAPAVGHRLSPQQLLLRVGMVVLVGALHDYLEELMEEFGDFLGSDFDKLSPIGQKYITLQIHGRLAGAFADSTEEEMGDPNEQKKFLTAVKECSGWLTDPTKLSASTSRTRIEGFFKFGSEAINRALTQFRDDGTNFFGWLATDPTYTTYFGRLDSAIAMRNEVAHGAVRSQMTMHEFRTHRVTVNRFVRKSETYVWPTLETARLASTSAPTPATP